MTLRLIVSWPASDTGTNRNKAMTIEIDKDVQNNDSAKHLIRKYFGMGQKGSRRVADTGSGEGVTGRSTNRLTRQVTVEIDHGFVKTRNGLVMAAQVKFESICLLTKIQSNVWRLLLVLEEASCPLWGCWEAMLRLHYSLGLSLRLVSFLLVRSSVCMSLFSKNIQNLRSL